MFTTTRANRVCKSFCLSLSVYQLNCLRTSKGLSLGELITYLLFQTLLPLFWTLTCTIWMELTRNDAVSAELPWCYFCAEIKVLGMTWNFTENIFGINKKYWRKNQGQGTHTLSKRVGARPLPCGPPGAPPTSTPTLYIHVWGEKNKRKGFIMFYDM